jgi:hypothetical protein
LSYSMTAQRDEKYHEKGLEVRVVEATLSDASRTRGSNRPATLAAMHEATTGMALHSGYSRKSTAVCASNRAFVKQEREHASSTCKRFHQYTDRDKLTRPTGVQGASGINALPFGVMPASGGTGTAQDMASRAAFFGKEAHVRTRSHPTHVTFSRALRNRRRAGLGLADAVAFNLGRRADTLGTVLGLGIAVLTLFERFKPLLYEAGM